MDLGAINKENDRKVTCRQKDRKEIEKNMVRNKGQRENNQKICHTLIIIGSEL